MTNFIEWISGLTGGIIGTLLCYPPDTIKTRLQVSKNLPIKELFKGNLYKGMFSPMIGVGLEKSTLFFAYNIMRDNTSLNEFQRGLASGLLTTLIVTPPERVKIKCQVNKINSIVAFKYIIKNDGVASLYRGWTATLGREVPGYGVYFYTFEKLKKYCTNPWKTFACGSITGMTAWAVIYPSDPIKTVMQSENINIKKAIGNIIQRNGFGGFYRGFSWALLRAGILHGGVILGYQTCKSSLS